MKEKDLVDILAITVDEQEVGKPLNECTPDWRHGWMHPQTYAEMLRMPPGFNMVDIPLQLNGIGEDVRFGLIHILPHLTPAHWDQWRGLS